MSLQYNNLQMNLLNDEEAKKITAGFSTGDFFTCNKAGDTIQCGGNKIIACWTQEVTCPSTFSSSCGGKSYSIDGCEPTIIIKDITWK